MGYVDYSFYKSIYGDSAATEQDFNRLSWEASRKIDVFTTGLDGIRKLAVAFPVDEYSAEAVKRCTCSLIQFMHQMQEAEKQISQSRGYTETENGLRGKVISSVSAGNESVSYSTGGNSGSATMIEKAVSDKSVRDKAFHDMITQGLSGIADANGVNLLYMGRYPAVGRKHV